LNLYDICLQVLEHANASESNLEDDMVRESIATEIYELFYEYQMYSPHIDTGYIEDLKDYWNYKQDLNDNE